MPVNPISRLSARHLRKSYQGREVVHDVSLEVASGEVVGLLGPNGAGKTTCFYMMVGLVSCDDGQIELDEQPIGHLPIHRRARLGLSYLPQEPSVFRKLSVEENIAAVLEMQLGDDGRRMPPGTLTRRLNELLDELQITHLRTHRALS
ncbi:MAG: ATP-binding cassette domain-containing protein, partial [Betaproteobacteria bacterium]|nr:ATP-binding cassette domain-containing protein [Betaproteobacteria bacterium]